MFPSIRSFLAFGYTLIVLLIVASLGVGIHTLVDHRLREDLDKGLESRARQIARFILSDTDTDLARQVQRLSGGINGGEPESDVIYIRLYDTSGLALPLDGPIPPIPDATPQELRRLKGPAIKTVVGREGTRMRVVTQPVLYRSAPIAYIQASRSLAPVERITGQLRSALVVGGVLAGLLAGLLAYILAYQALRPFSEIVEDTREIGADTLDRRLPSTYGVDEVSRLARSFNSLLDRLQNAFDLQKRFVADASHELRTPLTTIRGNIDVLLLDPRLSPEVRASLQNVSTESARLTRLISNLLLMARADVGSSPSSFRPVDLHALVLETVHQSLASTEDVSLSLGREDQVSVAGDADQLKQVLLNLVDNALKYTPSGGQVTVSVYSEGPWAKIEVSDNGIGISQPDLERIFDRFYRAERNLRGVSGSGLGLSIVHWVVRSHGGRITVESALGEGSTFTVWLPLFGSTDTTAADPGGPVSNRSLTNL